MAQNDYFEISRLYHDAGFAMKEAHTHSHYELFYLLSGSCTLQIGKDYYNLSAGEVAFIRPKLPHKTEYTAPSSERICLEFSSSYLAPLFNTWGEHWLIEKLAPYVFTLPEKEAKSIIYALDGLMEENYYIKPFSRELSTAFFNQVIVNMIRGNQNGSDVSTKDLAYNKNISMALDYINSNYTNKITLNDVANLLHLNASYFSKQFKDQKGIGFAEYVSNLRIIHAEGLLLETDKSITEIAFESGFDNSNYFGDVFKKKNNVSPSEFRKLKGFI